MHTLDTIYFSYKLSHRRYIKSSGSSPVVVSSTTCKPMHVYLLGYEQSKGKQFKNTQNNHEKKSCPGWDLNPALNWNLIWKQS